MTSNGDLCYSTSRFSSFLSFNNFVLHWQLYNSLWFFVFSSKQLLVLILKFWEEKCLFVMIYVFSLITQKLLLLFQCFQRISQCKLEICWWSYYEFKTTRLPSSAKNGMLYKYNVMLARFYFYFVWNNTKNALIIDLKNTMYFLLTCVLEQNRMRMRCGALALKGITTRIKDLIF